MAVTVRFFAAARAAAGVNEITLDPSSAMHILDQAAALHPKLGQVMRRPLGMQFPEERLERGNGRTHNVRRDFVVKLHRDLDRFVLENDEEETEVVIVAIVEIRQKLLLL